MEEIIKEVLIKLGADICGIANIDRFDNAPAGFHPTDVYKECKSVVVFAKSMSKGSMNVNPRIVYIKASTASLEVLDRISFLASTEIEKLGGIAVSLPSDSPYEYWDSDNMVGKGLISMKHAALAAGIGSMGKNTLIINEKFGNLINIGAVLTNLDLKSDPSAGNICIDNCRLCLDSCPQKALDGKTVNQRLCREYTYSTTKRGFYVCNCNSCRAVCPSSSGKQ